MISLIHAGTIYGWVWLDLWMVILQKLLKYTYLYSVLDKKVIFSDVLLHHEHESPKRRARSRSQPI